MPWIHDVVRLSTGQRLMDVGVKRAVIYAGMVNDKVFSIAYTDRERGYAYNLYFSVSAHQIEVNENVFEVEAPTPDSISLKYLETRRTTIS